MNNMAIIAPSVAAMITAIVRLAVPQAQPVAGTICRGDSIRGAAVAYATPRQTGALLRKGHPIKQSETIGAHDCR